MSPLTYRKFGQSCEKPYIKLTPQRPPPHLLPYTHLSTFLRFPLQVFINFVKQQVEIQHEPQESGRPQPPAGVTGGVTGSTPTELQPLSEETLEGTDDEDDVASRIDQAGVCSPQAQMPLLLLFIKISYFLVISIYKKKLLITVIFIC